MKKKILLVSALILAVQSLAFAKNIDIYDIHEHYVPDCYKKALLLHGTKGIESDGLPVPDWNIEKQLKFMDKMGIKTAFISLASPHPYWGNSKETIELVRKINDEGAQIVLKYSDRFKLFATLPLPDIENSLKEINYAYDELHAVGIKLPTSVNGVYLGDEKFAPVFEELNKRKAIVVLHPVQALNLPNSDIKEYPPAMALYLNETTLAVLNLIYSSTLEKYPDIKFIIPHAGALLPSLSDRLEGFQKLAQNKSKNKISDVKIYLNKFYYDLAGFAVPNQLFGLLNMTDISHLLYGSDYPYAYPEFITKQKEKLDKTKLLNKKDKIKIYKYNYEF